MLEVQPGYEQVQETWFEPEYWGSRARPVSAGGRGSAWFVDSEVGQLVLRHYRRGGFMANLSDRSYVYLGQRRTRSLREFRLLKALHEQGLPVPEPVAALTRRHRWVWYHAAILIGRIPNAVPLPDVPDIAHGELWRDVGRTIRRFHDAGLNHVDLNCDNILVAGGEIYLIDFDRCNLRPASDASGWQRANLERLSRSVDKRLPSFTPEQRTQLWNQLLDAYDGRS